MRAAIAALTCSPRAQLCTPYELETLICGSDRAFDVSALVSAASYEDGYDGHEAVIEYLWDVVREDMSDEQRRKLLFFTTGSDRVPIKGTRDRASPSVTAAR